ncbi:uncharacterized protein C8A04DRAFT_28487 [Dichotomopilus funicola]|uniref:Uncharacterized protein n=1 Tax=Dichotomopilus funicola TaxID=1934379 RepID=A0AAN6ZLQ6_9PEZI|nr:hypothetical protein C8A04DRAFT_28487 [Dichotomopilus funicola]
MPKKTGGGVGGKGASAQSPTNATPSQDDVNNSDTASGPSQPTKTTRRNARHRHTLAETVAETFIRVLIDEAFDKRSAGKPPSYHECTRNQQPPQTSQPDVCLGKDRSAEDGSAPTNALIDTLTALEKNVAKALDLARGIRGAPSATKPDTEPDTKSPTTPTAGSDTSSETVPNTASNTAGETATEAASSTTSNAASNTVSNTASNAASNGESKTASTTVPDTTSKTKSNATTNTTSKTAHETMPKSASEPASKPVSKSGCKTTTSNAASNTVPPDTSSGKTGVPESELAARVMAAMERHNNGLAGAHEIPTLNTGIWGGMLRLPQIRRLDKFVNMDKVVEAIKDAYPELPLGMAEDIMGIVLDHLVGQNIVTEDKGVTKAAGNNPAERA